MVKSTKDTVVCGAAAVFEAGEHIGRVEEGVATLDVVPDVDRLVALSDRIGAHPATSVRSRLIGDADVSALGVPLPTVERALDDLALDVSAEPEVCTEVFAVRVHHGHPAGLRPPRDQLGVEVLHCVHGADGDLV
jgi:hypothetical protein